MKRGEEINRKDGKPKRWAADHSLFRSFLPDWDTCRFSCCLFLSEGRCSELPGADLGGWWCTCSGCERPPKNDKKGGEIVTSWAGLSQTDCCHSQAVKERSFLITSSNASARQRNKKRRKTNVPCGTRDGFLAPYILLYFLCSDPLPLTTLLVSQAAV